MDESKSTLVQQVEKIYEKFSGRYGEELSSVTAKWEKTGLLRNLEPYPASQIALMMENQRLIKELVAQDPTKYDMDYASAQLFLDGQMAAVRRIYDPRFFIGFDLVSTQTLLGPAGLVYYWKLGFKQKPAFVDTDDHSLQQQASGEEQVPDPAVEWTLEKEDWCAKTRKMKTFLHYMPPDTKSKNEKLEAGAAALGKMAWDVTQEINREILTDIRNNVGTVGTLEYADSPQAPFAQNLYSKTAEMSGVLWRKTLFGRANWIVTNPRISAMLKQCGGFEEEEEILTYDGSPAVLKMGTWLGQYKLYEDPLFPDTILMGHKSTNPFGSGYFYGPYVPLTATPRIVDPEFCPRPGLMTRYAKKLLRFGAKFYGRIDIKGLPKEESR